MSCATRILLHRHRPRNNKSRYRHSHLQTRRSEERPAPRPMYLALPLQIFGQFFSLARPNLHFYEFCDQFEYDSDLFRSIILSLSKGQVTVCITPLSCKSLSTYLPLPVRLTRCTRPRVRHHTRYMTSRIIAHKITARYLRRIFFRFRLPYWKQ